MNKDIICGNDNLLFAPKVIVIVWLIVDGPGIFFVFLGSVVYYSKWNEQRYGLKFEICTEMTGNMYDLC